jgi:hypothetical protein
MPSLSDVSVAMPYWMRQKELDRSLVAYRRIYGDALEIVICDDGSPVPVVAPGCKITSLPQKKIGLNPCVPINVAVRACTRDIIVLTNPEVEHRENVLNGMLAMFEHELDYITVRCLDVDTGMWIAGPDVEYTPRTGRFPVPPGAHFHFCAMFHRSLFERVGGFDERFRHGRACEDNDWLWTVAQGGARFKLAPGIVYHYRTPHPYAGENRTNVDLLTSKWSHRWSR